MHAFALYLWAGVTETGDVKNDSQAFDSRLLEDSACTFYFTCVGMGWPITFFY